MRRPRNPATMVHSLSCTDTEWERVRERADAAGLSMSRYLVERALTVELPRDEDGKIGPPPRLVLRRGRAARDARPDRTRVREDVDRLGGRGPVGNGAAG